MTEQELIELCSIGEIWLTDQKNEVTTQKDLDALDSTTQKKETTVRKPLNIVPRRMGKLAQP